MSSHDFSVLEFIRGLSKTQGNGPELAVLCPLELRPATRELESIPPERKIPTGYVGDHLALHHSGERFQEFFSRVSLRKSRSRSREIPTVEGLLNQ